MSSSATAFFDTLANDPHWHDFTAEESQRVDDYVRRWQIHSGQHVIEPGCGAGRLTERLAALTGPTGRVVAFDISHEFIRTAQQRGLPTHVALQVAAASNFDVPPASFDHVVCFNAFPHLTPLRLVTPRLVAALRPGAHFWIAHTKSRQFVNAIHREGPASIQDHLIPEPAELTRLLTASGLTAIAIEDEPDHFFASARRPTS